MKNMLIAAAVTAALSSLPVGAFAAPASNAQDVAQIREQLQGLMQRVDRLEQENTQLKSENAGLKAQGEELKAQGDYLRSEAKGLRKDTANLQADTAKVKGVDWASKVSLKGDLRYRYEMIEDDLSNSSSNDNVRYRDRIRARLGLDAKVLDNLKIGLQLATGGDDPRSSNQTLGTFNARKAIGLDLAYFDWKYADWGNLVGGKMKNPVVRPGQSLFYDGDVNPEGLALGFNQGMFFGSAYYFWLDERSTAADAMQYGAQVGTRLPIGGNNLMLAVHYSQLAKAQGYRPFWNCAASTAAIGSNRTIGCANGNTVVGADQNSATLAYDFKILELAAEWNMTVGSLPLQVWGNWAKNQDPDDLNTAWGAGLLLGKASDRRSWEVGAAYQKIEKDALFAQLVDSDFADGKTDGKGWVLRAGYAPQKNWTLNATYFINQRQVEVGPQSDYDRMQLDFNLKF